MRVLVIMTVGLLLMVGAISMRKALRWLGYFVLVIITAPFYTIILKMVPGWLLLALLAIAVWRMFRLIAEALLGREAASHMVGILAADVVHALFRCSMLLAVFPFRVLRNVWRAAR